MSKPWWLGISLGSNPVWGVAGHVPFAETPSGVALLLEDFGHGDLLGMDDRVDGFDIAFFGHTERMATGHEGSPGRIADVLGIEVGELHPLFCNLVEARSADIFGAEAADVGIAQVVDEDEDEVGAVILDWRQSRGECCDKGKEHILPWRVRSFMVLKAHWFFQFGDWKI